MAIVSAKVSDALKKESESVIQSLGISMSAAINAFLVQVVNNNGIPFPLKNKEWGKSDKQTISDELFKTDLMQNIELKLDEADFAAQNNNVRYNHKDVFAKLRKTARGNE